MTNFHKKWTLVKQQGNRQTYVKGDLSVFIEHLGTHYAAEVWLTKIHLVSLIGDSEKEIMTKVDLSLGMIHGQLAQSLGKISVR